MKSAFYAYFNQPRNSADAKLRSSIWARGLEALSICMGAVALSSCTWIYSDIKRTTYPTGGAPIGGGGGGGGGVSLKHATWVSDPTLPLQLNATGLSGSSAFSVVSGSGSVNPSTGIFTPGSLVARDSIQVRVTDPALGTADATITQIPTWLWTNGVVRAVTFDGLGGMYVGGDFTSIGKRYPAPYFSALDLTTGLPNASCDFRSGFNSLIRAVTVTADAIFVGGNFTQYRGVSVERLAKLNRFCELDTIFTQAGSGFNGGEFGVYALAVSGNSLYVGGDFTQYRGVANNAQRLAKLDLASGNLDTTFTHAASGFNDFVRALAVGGSSLYVGGTFTQYRGVANNAQGLAKLDLSSGNLDTNFTQAENGLNSSVHALAVDGSSLYLGGHFTAYRGVANNAQRLAKLDLTSGNLDTTFTQAASGLNGRVRALAVGGSSLYLGGEFTQYRGVANNAQGLAKLDLSSGNLDTNFTQAGSGIIGVNSTVYTLAVNGSSLYVGGNFTQYRGVANNAQRLAKLDLTSGNLDTTFTQAGSGFNGSVYALAVGGSSLYVGGEFTQYRGVDNNSQRLAKLNLTSGNLDTTFTQAGSGFDLAVNALVVNGTSIYAGGPFTQYRGVANNAQGLAKLDLASGNLDTNFTQAGSGIIGVNSTVYALAVNGSSLYVGGWFTQYRGVANNAQGLAKLDLASGNLDTNFTQAGSGFTGYVSALAVNGSSLYVGGEFTQYRGVANNAQRLAKLDLASGNLDTNFTQAGSGFNSYVLALAVNGSSLYVGGNFTQYRGVSNSAQKLAKLDLTSGNLDTNFTQTGSGFGSGFGVSALAVSESSLYVGGDFTQYRGVANNAKSLAKLDLTSGTLDTTFTQAASGFDNVVRALAVSGNSLYVGGDFTQYRGSPNNAQWLGRFDLNSGDPN